jgi:hypothetical protein
MFTLPGKADEVLEDLKVAYAGVTQITVYLITFPTLPLANT